MKNFRLVNSNTLIIILTVILIEILSRLCYQKITTASGRYIVEVAQATSFLGFDETSIKTRFQPHPYMLYQLTPNYPGDFKTNSLGYRNREITIEKELGVTRIMALGGSTTYGASVFSEKQTWPSQLENYIRAKSNRKVEVINGGVDSASSAEILSAWIYKYRFLKPDIVLLNMGINDIWPILLTKSYNHDYLNFRAAQSYLRAGKLSSTLMNISCFYKVLWGHYFSWNFQGDFSAGYPYIQVHDADLKYSELNGQEVTKRALSVNNTVFKENFDMLIKIMKMDGVKVFVVMEQSMEELDFIEKTTRVKGLKFIKGLEKPWLIVKSKNEKIMKDVADKNNVKFLMLNNNEFELEWYTDWYHMNDIGEKRKAEIIGKSLFNNFLIK